MVIWWLFRLAYSPSMRFMAYINQAPMRIGMEDPWALTELAKAGGPGRGAAPQA